MSKPTKKEKRLVSVANKIATTANAKDKNFSIDPFTIIAIINVIVGLIRIIMECRKRRDQAKAIIRKPGILARFIMRREIRKNFPPSQRKSLYDAMLVVSSSLSDKELDDSLDLIEWELNQK